MNGVTGAEFEPLHTEYYSSNNGHSTNGCRYMVTYYIDGNEMQQYETASRMLAEHMAWAKQGSFITIGVINA